MTTVPPAMQVRLAPAMLLGGFACGVASVAVHTWWWGLVLETLVTVLTVVAAPPGWGTRLPFAVGDIVAVGAASVPRGEGDYLVAASPSGYALLALTLLVAGFSLATLPRPGRPDRPAPQSDTPGPES